MVQMLYDCTRVCSRLRAFLYSNRGTPQRGDTGACCSLAMILECHPYTMQPKGSEPGAQHIERSLSPYKLLLILFFSFFFLMNSHSNYLPKRKIFLLESEDSYMKNVYIA